MLLNHKVEQNVLNGSIHALEIHLTVVISIYLIILHPLYVYRAIVCKPVFQTDNSNTHAFMHAWSENEAEEFNETNF